MHFFKVVMLMAAVLMAAVLTACGTNKTSSSTQAPTTTQVSTSATTTIAIVGDSFTTGTDVGGLGPHNWVPLMTAQLERDGYSVNTAVEAGGASGYTKPGYRNLTFAQMAKLVVTPSTNYVIIFGGFNDHVSASDELDTASSQLYAEVKKIAPLATLIVIGPLLPDEDLAPKIIPVRDVLKKNAQAAGVLFIDPIDESWFSDGNSKMISTDGIHPNDDGHQAMAKRIAAIIENIDQNS